MNEVPKLSHVFPSNIIIASVETDLMLSVSISNACNSNLLEGFYDGIISEGCLYGFPGNGSLSSS